MYPKSELIRLAAYKMELRRLVFLRRQQCAEAAGRVARPLEWLDRAVAVWRHFAPFAQIAAVPLGFLFKRAVFPRQKILGSLVRWGPVVFNAVRGFRSAHRAAPEESR